MRYFKTESGRAFLSCRFLLSIAGVTLTYFFSLYKVAGIYDSVYTTYINATSLIPFLVTLTICAIPFSHCFCEDMEYHYIFQTALRCPVWKYVLVKILLIYLTAISTMVLGTVLFVLIIRLKVPWTGPESHWMQYPFVRVFFDNDHFLVYYIVHSFFTGLLAGFLSVLAAFGSLFWQNRLDRKSVV